MIKRKHPTAGKAAVGRSLRVTIPGDLRREIRKRYDWAIDDRTDKICIRAMIIFILGNQWKLTDATK